MPRTVLATYHPKLGREAALEAACEFLPVGALREAQQLFSAFEAVAP